MKQKNKGFTLIEIAIALCVVAILAVIAINVFTYQARKGRRIDAINSLLGISLAEERYRSNNSTYGTLTQVWGTVTTSASGYYTLTVSNVTSTSYTVTATAVGNQASDAVNGTTCTPLILSISNGATSYTPTVCWPS